MPADESTTSAADVHRARPPLGRTFLRIWSTQTLSIVGSTLSGVGVAVWVYLETGDARWLGMLAAAAAVPFVVMAPVLGRLDRYPRRTMLLVGDCLAAVGPVVALALALAGRLEVWHLVVAGFLGGVGNAVQTPAAAATVPALVGSDSPEVLARANGLFQLGPAAGIVIGPALATPLVAWFGVEAVLLVDVATFVVAVTTTLCTPFADATGGAPAPADDGSWASALGWLRTHGRALLTLLAAMGLVNFLLAFVNVSLIAVATDVGGASLAGLALAAGGVAMVAGSFATGAVGVAHRPVRVAAVGLAVVGVGAAVAALRPWFPLVVLGVLVALAPVAVVSAGTATLFHTRVPVRMHGRVFAVRSTIARSLDPLGSVAAGFVIAQVAAPAMAGGAGGGVLGWLLAPGAERGAALVLLTTGLALGALALWIGRSRRLATLDQAADASGDAAPAGEVSGAAAPAAAAP